MRRSAIFRISPRPGASWAQEAYPTLAVKEMTVSPPMSSRTL